MPPAGGGGALPGASRPGDRSVHIQIRERKDSTVRPCLLGCNSQTGRTYVRACVRIDICDGLCYNVVALLQRS
jgi:hypothetical protein